MLKERGLETEALKTELGSGQVAPDGWASVSEPTVSRRSPFSRSVYGDLIQFTDFVLVTAASVLVMSIPR